MSSTLDAPLATPAPETGPGALAVTQERVPTRRRYLMCEPRFFTVEYVINPWMRPDQPVSTERAVEQWTELKRTYERLGHQVETIEPQPGLPDMVFAANSGTVIDGRVLGARFRAEQRSAEAEHYRRWFLEHGYRSVVMPEKINEAEGDFAWTGGLLLAGTGFRTDPGAHAEAQEVLGVPVVSLRLVDPRYYHLDVALFVLDDQSERPLVAYYPEAFSAGSQRVLRRLFPDAVIANDADAECLGLNGVSDGRNVVLPKEATHLAERIAERGFEPVLVDISELRKSGGGPKCCTMELRG
ncbi:N-Dimethylarginine dimethylaminohydrolase [Streptoalloteichus tenebrarius]|uniref:N-Dimethylarginine dimethylaminohydrolase n=1 Tax=Streptoalloteichus tenebrarius (strain ATCC 17920 / DSM 40477 / JCM 4838 / CBS 697.72 / NBRC 16177 / NCIMB 11028 / NRRL B-12390 / A12253. 1 / ISP 5477) TaxID=1933 RepID=A0ABT1HY01_STRSD|nr:N-Dimethylarginine dimethylaminohydrolase [Streptoalloteichus tenebrarius]BFF02507.1 amidinotransferase [Streptoalloteichus tenebrarius]